MSEERFADFEEIAAAWDRLSDATKVVECALPSQMTLAMQKLVAARADMDATVRQVGLRIARVQAKPTP